MGEELIRLPPRSKKVCITCARAARSLSSLPTLKVIQVPRPMAGICSPVDGIAFFRMAPEAGPWPNAGRAVVAPKPVIEPTNARRVRCFMASTWHFYR